MADVKSVDEGAELPEKRKLDPPGPITESIKVNNDESGSNKKPKIEVPSEKNGCPISPPAAENAAEPDEHCAAAEEGDEENDDEEEDDYNAEEDEEGDEDVTEEPKIVDRKGKGIMIDDKGKGKMLEDSEDDDSDDDDGSSDDSDSDFSDGLDESDLEDDPLAEVDLDNILPSRTRRRQVQSGVRIGGNPNRGNDV
ncbi:hypothetical protein PHJA_001386600 [Phtheirospermum japonicum]|uniref:Uncharacterized protein n=1 Tax=Phtheirospermum japonicum TaxID=374723 RepID=A0A830C7S3_9LAMI|nr:hypothetical protein PHJA_001386600 [Phtheirospermum japonicum]